MDMDLDLAKEFAEFAKGLPDDCELTIDDFFNIYKVPKEQRSDFLVAAMLKQAREKYGL